MMPPLPAFVRPAVRTSPLAPAREPAPSPLVIGGRLLVVRASHAEDTPLVQAMLERSSERSRYRRFLSPVPRVTERLARQLATPIPGKLHGLLVLDRGRAVAIAHVGRAGDEDAEIALLVEDIWQGRGLGTALVRRAAGLAVAGGHRAVTGTILRDNKVALRMIFNAFPGAQTTFDGPYCEFRAELPAT